MQGYSAAGTDMKYYLAIIIKRRYLALATALTVLSVFTWGSFFWPKEYEASSKVLIEKSSIIDPLMKDVSASRGTEDIVSSLKDKMTSRSLLEKVIRQLNFAAPSKQSQYEGLIDDIRKRLVITVQGNEYSKGSDVVTVTYRGSNPRKARDMVNVLISQFFEESVGYRKNDANSAFNFISGQLLEYKNKLDESDREIREFRERNPQVVPQDETAIVRNIEQLQTAQADAEIKLKELMSRRENLRKQLSGEKKLTVAFVSNDSSPEGRLNYLNNQLVLLMGKYTDKYPEVIKVKSEIEELKKEIAQGHAADTHGGASEMSTMNPVYQKLKEDLGNTDAEIDSLRARIAELSRQQQRGQGRLGSMPREQEEWAKIERNRTVYQKIYNDLLQKLESARVSANLEDTVKSEAFKVLNPALLPSLPSKPNRVLVILTGIFMGLASGIGLAVGLEYMNPSFRDETDIESKLKLPVLCTVPGIMEEDDNASERKRDMRIFTAAGAYLFIIGLVFVSEFLYRYMGIKTIIF